MSRGPCSPHCHHDLWLSIGESRKSFHGYPDGFAQLIESPTEWHITPMQIDTRNRDCGSTYKDVKNCTQMVPNIEPRAARYGRGWQGPNKPALPSNYSGILECPCNSRYGGDPMFYPHSQTKVVEHKYNALPTGTCPAGQSIATADECFSVMRQIGVFATKYTNKTISDKTQPAGCSVVSNTDGSATVTFNNAAGAAACAEATSSFGEAQTRVGVNMKVALAPTGKATMSRSTTKGTWCSDNRQNIIKQFDSVNGDDAKALSDCEAFCLTNAACNFCSVDSHDPTKGDKNSWNAIPACGTINKWEGSLPGDISSKVTGGNATFTISGPADAWYGVGLNAQNMADSPYSLIVNSTGVWEQQLGTCGSEAEHCPGDTLAKSITLLSNSVAGNVRTVEVSRPFNGATPKHFTFTHAVGTLNFIAAVGKDQVFAYHAAHDAATVTFTATAGKPTCICDQGATGKLCSTGGTGCNSFVKGCVARSPDLGRAGTTPSGDLLAQRNPTCNSGQYAGGLRCCGHKRIMLDSDQEVRPELLQYHMKFRFW